MSFNTFGLETVLKLVGDSIKKEDDALVVFIHWLLVKNEFLCIGLGENVDVPDNVEKTEILPEGWSTAETYAIRYLDPNEKLFILRGLKNDVNIIFNFVRAEDLNVTSVSFNPTQEVTALRGSVGVMYPNYQDIGARIQSSLISPQQKEQSKESATQTKSVESDRSHGPCPNRDPLMIGSPRLPSSSGQIDPYNYGRSDLDPLANMGGTPGGGMIFDPFGQSRGRIDPNAGLPGRGLPRGAVPPNARFDPFGPPDPEAFGLRSPRNSGPRLPGSGSNPDMLPPGYDDMFM